MAVDEHRAPERASLGAEQEGDACSDGLSCTTEVLERLEGLLVVEIVGPQREGDEAGGDHVQLDPGAAPLCVQRVTPHIPSDGGFAPRGGLHRSDSVGQLPGPSLAGRSPSSTAMAPK